MCQQKSLSTYEYDFFQLISSRTTWTTLVFGQWSTMKFQNIPAGSIITSNWLSSQIFASSENFISSFPNWLNFKIKVINPRYSDREVIYINYFDTICQKPIWFSFKTEKLKIFNFERAANFSHFFRRYLLGIIIHLHHIKYFISKVCKDFIDCFCSTFWKPRNNILWITWIFAHSEKLKLTLAITCK